MNNSEQHDDFNGKMRLYRYWKTMFFEIIIDGRPQKIKCTAGSNHSNDDAAERCAAKAERVQKIINHQVERSWSYERPIREEVIRDIDADNVVTRNSYGALILNTTSLNIFDIDRYQRSFWEMFTFKKFDNKAAIVQKLKTLHAQQTLPGTTWRIYETTKGIRLIVLGAYIEPSSEVFKKFCLQINADNLYAFMCQKQNCYRARLTPKPHRMKIPCIKYRCPIPEGQETAYRDWVANYENESRNFAVCRLVEELGSKFSDNAMVDFHDRICLNDNASRLA